MNTRNLTLLALLAALAGSGCAENRGALEAYAICAMPDDCMFKGECDAYQLGAIGYSASMGGAYLQFGVEMRNQLANNAAPSVGRVNTNDAHILSTRLEIEGPVSGTIELDVGHHAVPAGGTAVVWTYVLPPNSVAALPTGTYNVGVVYIGYYDNGNEFETPPFPIAVELDAGAGATTYGCPAGKVLSCGSAQQSLIGCN